MATQNITISTEGWQNLTSELSLSSGNTYTVTLLGGSGEICIADATPADGFYGHPINDGQNFSFTYSGTDAYVKIAPFYSKATIVFS